MTAGPLAALAALSEGAATDLPRLLLVLAAIIGATKLGGELMRRLGQPAVLGELLAGVILGGSALALVSPDDPTLHVLSELGVIVLLFQVGLETDLRAMAKVGPAALAVAIVGVALPFAGGLGVASALGVASLPALVLGAALTATSVGISARVLTDLGRLRTPEGQVVLGAAVLDDVVGLVILSTVSVVVAGGALTVGGVARIATLAIGFLAVALVIGSLLLPRAFEHVERRLALPGAVGMAGLAVAFVTAALAARAGSALIIGAFAAGLVLHGTPQRHVIEHSMQEVGHFLVPIFFAVVGASVDVRALLSGPALTMGGLLIVVAIVGKVAAGYAPVWFRGSKLLVGMAMVPRGEVGLIFAQMGKTSGVLDDAEFGALMLMVVVTTFVTPPALGWLSRRLPEPTLVATSG